MKKIDAHLAHLKKSPFALVLRVDDYFLGQRVIQAAVLNGFQFIEITTTVPNALKLIADTKAKYPDVIVGAGTVQTLEVAKQVINANGQYLVSPTFSKEILAWSLQNDIFYLPGAMTVNECHQIVENGGQLIKLYPANILGFEFVKLVLNPFPHFKFFIAGGVNLASIEQWFEAGAFGVGITANLGQPEKEVSDATLNTRAQAFVKSVYHAMQKHQKR